MTAYKINWMEKKTSSKGLPYIKASLIAEGESEITDVAIFSSFPMFAELTVGMQVMGEIKTTVKGNFTNNTLEYPPMTPQNGRGGAYKQKMIEDTMQRKETSIKGFQTSKEEGIKLSSVNNKAVDCAIAEWGKDPHNLITLEELIEKYRKYLWMNWDNPMEYPPFK